MTNILLSSIRGLWQSWVSCPALATCPKPNPNRVLCPSLHDHPVRHRVPQNGCARLIQSRITNKYWLCFVQTLNWVPSSPLSPLGRESVYSARMLVSTRNNCMSATLKTGECNNVDNVNDDDEHWTLGRLWRCLPPWRQDKLSCQYCTVGSPPCSRSP